MFILATWHFLPSPSISTLQEPYNSYLSRLGLNRDQAETEYQNICGKCGHLPSEGESIHFRAFAALHSADFRPRNILELGTSTGKTTTFLARLFDKSVVYTVELPEDDPIFRKYHGDGKKARLKSTDLNEPNIRAFRVNTAFLERLDFPDFDLIWIDAGHEFPEIAWDHFYAIGKLCAGGWLFSDDIRPPNNRLYRRLPGAFDAYKVIEYFNTRQDIKFDFLLKRENPRLYLVDRKYIAFLHMPI